jgi:hypothetical protein
VSATKMSRLLLVSPGTRLEENESKATNRPSAEMEGLNAPPELPAESNDTKVVVLVSVSRTKMSLIVESRALLKASDSNATNRPSAEMEGFWEKKFV